MDPTPSPSDSFSLFAEIVRRCQQDLAARVSELCHEKPGLSEELQLFAEDLDITLHGFLDDPLPTLAPPDPCAADQPPTLTHVQSSADTSDNVTGLDDLFQIIEDLTAPVARYDVGGELARGGMGNIRKVYDRLLHRDVVRKVLLDPVFADRQRWLRFLNEAVITAQLDHPAIVAVHDLGLDELGAPYFTMKRVVGRTFLHVIDETHRESGAWTTNRALGTLLRAAEAVAFAHEAGVTHRDLKPENLMVGTFGRVFVMDWGIARCLPNGRDGDSKVTGLQAVQRQLGEGQVDGSPHYMSPEQAAGEATSFEASSDVYALGSILYHLLSGRRPYLAPNEMPSGPAVVRRVKDGPPEPLGEVTTGVPETLRDLCELAMARRPEDRPTSAEFSAELQDFLHDVSEGAERERMLARRAERRAALLREVLDWARPDTAQGRSATVREALDHVAEALQEDDRDPDGKLAAHATLGEVYLSLDERKLGRAQLLEALRLARKHRGIAHPETQHVLTTFANLIRREGDTPHAVRLLRAVLRNQQGRLGNAHVDVLATKENLAQALQEQLHYQEAELLQREVVEGRVRLLGPDDPEVLQSRLTLTRLAHELHGSASAIGPMREVLGDLERHLGPTHPETLVATSNLAHALVSVDQDEAVELYQGVLATQRKIMGPRHRHTVRAAMGLAHALSTAGRDAEAEHTCREILTDVDGHPDVDPGDVAFLLTALGRALRGLGRAEEAVTVLERAVTEVVDLHGPAHQVMGRFRHHLSLALEDSGRTSEALAQTERALAELTVVLGEDHGFTKESVRCLARMQAAYGGDAR